LKLFTNNIVLSFDFCCSLLYYIDYKQMSDERNKFYMSYEAKAMRYDNMKY